MARQSTKKLDLDVAKSARSPERRKSAGNADAVNEYAEIIRSSNGNITDAARRLGMPRERLAAHVRKSATLRAVVDDARGALLDYAETQLRAAIERGEDWAIKYALDSTRAAPRGWRKAPPPASAADGSAPPLDVQVPPLDVQALREMGIGPEGI